MKGFDNITIDIAFEFEAVAKLAEEEMLNFTNAHRHFVVVVAKLSRVPVTLTGTQSPGVIFRIQRARLWRICLRQCLYHIDPMLVSKVRSIRNCC